MSSHVPGWALCGRDAPLRPALVQPHGFYMATHSGEDVVSSALQQTGRWESSSIETLGVDNATDLHAGTFIDIGANLGYFSFLFARRGYRVFAVEPLFANRCGIEATLCLNKEFAAEGRFTIIPTPIGAPARCKMVSNFRNRGNGRLSCESASRSTFRPCAPRRPSDPPLCENMSTAPLDEVLRIVPKDTPRPVVVKIDLEGYECGALETGHTALFERIGADLITVEAKEPKTKQCVLRAATRYSYQLATPWGADQNQLLCKPGRPMQSCVARFALEPGAYMTRSGPNTTSCAMAGGPVRRACMRALRSNKRGSKV